MQRFRQRKLSIDLVIEENKFLREHLGVHDSDFTHTVTDEDFSSSFASKKIETQREILSANHINPHEDFFENLNIFEIKIKTINSSVNKNQDSKDFHDHVENNFLKIRSGEKKTKSIEKNDIDDSFTLVSLQKTEDNKRTEIQKTRSREKCTMEENNINSSNKATELYQQMAESLNSKQKLQISRFPSDHEEETEEHYSGMDVCFSQEGNECCQIM